MDRFVIRGGSPATKAGSQTSQTVSSPSEKAQSSAVKRRLNSLEKSISLFCILSGIYKDIAFIDLLTQR